jgi:hypothetical protein
MQKRLVDVVLAGQAPEPEWQLKIRQASGYTGTSACLQLPFLLAP